MSDNTPETAATDQPTPEVVPPEKTEVSSSASPTDVPVDDLVEVTPTTTTTPTTTGPVVAATDPEEPATPVPTEQEPPPRLATSSASMQTVYVTAPVPPVKKGNRGAGLLIALASTVIFAGLYAIAIAVIHAAEIGVLRFDFFDSLAFYTPAIFFFVGFAIVVLLANRAAWWAYVLGSIFVGLLVYFGSVGAGLLANNILGETPASAARLFAEALANPFVIAAALLAREVSMWMGAAISARGRRMKARNIEARDTFDRESADRSAEFENSRYGTRDASA